MPLETATYISDLNPAYPAHSDGLNNDDAHARLIKGTIKTTFPNITGAVTATHTALNAAGAAATSGATLLASAGTFFNTNPTDGFQNILAGDIDVKLQGAIAATFTQSLSVNTLKNFGNLTNSGTLTSTGLISGPGMTPLGAGVLWFDDTLPADGMWCWANGQIISSANTVCPVLLARWGSKYGGNGVTTMGVPNMQEVTPVGKSGMGGATSPGLLASISSGLKGVLGSLFGADTNTLTSAQIPAHKHPAYIYDPQHYHSDTAGGIASGYGYGNGGIYGYVPQTTSTGYAATGVRVRDASSNLDTTDANTGGGGAHNNVQPSMAVGWIIRLG